MSANPKKITVLLDPHEFRRFDEFCRERGFKKSTLLARLIREFLESEITEDDEPLPLFDDDRTLRPENQRRTR